MVTPDSTANSGPESYPSKSRQRQAVAEEQAAHAEIVSSSQSAVAVKPAVETLGQLPREEPNKSSSPTRLCHDGKQQSATHIPQDPCASPKTQAVSRSLFGAPPSRSQLDALFGRERMQVSCSVYPLRATSGGRTTLSTTSLLHCSQMVSLQVPACRVKRSSDTNGTSTSLETSLFAAAGSTTLYNHLLLLSNI